MSDTEFTPADAVLTEEDLVNEYPDLSGPPSSTSPKLLSNGMLEYGGSTWVRVGSDPRDELRATRDAALLLAREATRDGVSSDYVLGWLSVAATASEQLRHEGRAAAARIIAMHLANA